MVSPSEQGGGARRPWAKDVRGARGYHLSRGGNSGEPLRPLWSRRRSPAFPWSTVRDPTCPTCQPHAPPGPPASHTTQPWVTDQWTPLVRFDLGSLS